MALEHISESLMRYRAPQNLNMDQFEQKMIEIAKLGLGALAQKIIFILGEDDAMILAENIKHLVIIHRN